MLGTRASQYSLTAISWQVELAATGAGVELAGDGARVGVLTTWAEQKSEHTDQTQVPFFPPEALLAAAASNVLSWVNSEQ